MIRQTLSAFILIAAVMALQAGCTKKSSHTGLDMTAVSEPSSTANGSSTMSPGNRGIDRAAGPKNGEQGSKRGADKTDQAAPGPKSPADGGPLKGFSKADGEERVGESIMVAKAGPTGGEKAGQRALLDVYFALDHWELSPEGKKNLAENAEYLKQNPKVKLLIEGHCDERGSPEYNIVLGEKRALETLRFLTALGVKNSVNITSYGKERPVCNEHEEPCYWKNRRAHLIVDEPK